MCSEISKNACKIIYYCESQLSCDIGKHQEKCEYQTSEYGCTNKQIRVYRLGAELREQSRS